MKVTVMSRILATMFYTIFAFGILLMGGELWQGLTVGALMGILTFLVACE